MSYIIWHIIWDQSPCVHQNFFSVTKPKYIKACGLGGIPATIINKSAPKLTFDLSNLYNIYLAGFNSCLSKMLFCSSNYRLIKLLLVGMF